MTRRVTLTLILALGALFAGCGEKGKPGSKSAAESSGLKITAWNLQWFPGKTPSGGTPAENAAHIAAVISELKAIDADILLLQEIRDPAALQEIVKAIPEYSLDIVSDFRGNLEVAILTRAPAKATEGFMQAFEEREEANPPRGFAYATVMLTDESVLVVYSVRLKSNSGGIEETTPKREESARQLIAHCNGLKERFEKEGKEFFAVIGGDFNSDPTNEKWAEDDTLSMMQDAGFRWAGQGVDHKELISWLTDGRYPDAVFDHMIVMAPEGYEVSQSSTHKTDRSVSDHRAVVLELTGLR
jgi:endonuclease/exonuclease/phosphatase family metal-dependent hydrolase